MGVIKSFVSINFLKLMNSTDRKLINVLENYSSSFLLISYMFMIYQYDLK